MPQRVRSSCCLQHLFVNIMQTWTSGCTNIEHLLIWRGPLWSSLYGSWIYNYLCNLLIITKVVRSNPVYGKVYSIHYICQWLAVGLCFSPGISIFSTNNTACHDITEILLKVALNTITWNPNTILDRFDQLKK